MKPTEFSLIADERLPRPDAERRLLHIGEGIADEMRAHAVELPVAGKKDGKIVVWVRPVERREPVRRAASIDGNVEIELRVEPTVFGEPIADLRERIFEALAARVRDAGAELEFDPAPVVEAIARAQRRQHVGRIELDWLRKRLRGEKAAIHVIHDVTERDARTWLEVRREDGRATSREIRVEPHPVGWWASFPAHSAKISGDDYVLSRRDGRPLYQAKLSDLLGGSANER